jgi:5'-3' exonuclease
MGIKDLNKILRSKCPNVFEQIHLSEYAYSKLAIDVSLFLCKFKAINGENWLLSFIHLICCLRNNEIHCIFIYDNGHPEEKTQEKAERVQAREKTLERIVSLENAIGEYEETKIVPLILQDLYDKLNGSKNEFNINVVVEKVKKMRSNVFSISKEDFDLTKQLFDIFHIQYYIAPLEAETMCADLCKRGLVSGVLSEDTDVLAYSSPVFLTKIDVFNNTCIRIVHNEILKTLKLNKDEFLDLCIMLGTDYNKNIPKVGCETSFKYIQQYRRLENMIDFIDVSFLKYERTRELFLGYERYEFDKEIPYNGFPDYEGLQILLSKLNLYYDMQKVRNSYATKVFFAI